MGNLRISATAARNNFFEILTRVSLGEQVVIEKDAKEIAKIVPITSKAGRAKMLKASAEVHGVLKGYKVSDNPLRKKGSAKFLGNWDK